ncbi:hypothetical protein GGH95_002314, partial [Coemansia sp. RSA 1836]
MTITYVDDVEFTTNGEIVAVANELKRNKGYTVIFVNDEQDGPKVLDALKGIYDCDAAVILVTRSDNNTALFEEVLDGVQPTHSDVLPINDMDY